MLLEDSANKWKNSFFYVRNLSTDHINLPPFVNAPSRVKMNLGYYPRNPSQEVLNLSAWLSEMKARERLTGTDLIAAFIMRWVLPLQRCNCLIG